MKRLISIICIFLAVFASAQDKVFTSDELLLVVKQHHPVALQAALQNDFTEAGVLAAKGNFDPIFSSDIGRKKVGNQLYYEHAEHQLKIPTWYGVDLYAGAETVNGLRVDPRDTRGAVSFVGLSVPVGRNMLFDSRRAAVKQAEIMEKLSVEEQREVLNDLAAEALKAYWNWWQQYTTWQIYTTATQNAGARFELVKLAFRHGERPAIDTLEALTQLQDFLQARTDAENNLINGRIELSAYLWVEGKQLYELPEDVVPQQFQSNWDQQLLSMEALMNAAALHPLLTQNQLRIEGLKVDERLKKQALLPAVNLKYNQLTTSYQINEALVGPWLKNDYRYGITLSMPLRLSQGRGDYQRARIKTAQAELEQSRKQVLVENKLKQAFNSWKQLQQQVALQEQKLLMLRQLQRGEEIRFLNGESSLFLINNREAKALEAEQKLVELKSKLQQAANQVLWAGGNLMR